MTTSIGKVVHGAETRREVAQALRGLGIEGAALDAICSLGAAHRHQQRVEAARAAALAADKSYQRSLGGDWFVVYLTDIIFT